MAPLRFGQFPYDEGLDDFRPCPINHVGEREEKSEEGGSSLFSPPHVRGIGEGNTADFPYPRLICLNATSRFRNLIISPVFKCQAGKAVLRRHYGG